MSEAVQSSSEASSLEQAHVDAAVAEEQELLSHAAQQAQTQHLMNRVVALNAKIRQMESAAAEPEAKEEE